MKLMFSQWWPKCCMSHINYWLADNATYGQNTDLLKRQTLSQWDRHAVCKQQRKIKEVHLKKIPKSSRNWCNYKIRAKDKLPVLRWCALSLRHGLGGAYCSAYSAQVSWRGLHGRAFAPLDFFSFVKTKARFVNILALKSRIGTQISSLKRFYYHFLSKRQVFETECLV